MLIAILPLLLALQQPPAESSTLGAAEQLLRQNRYEDAIRELNPRWSGNRSPAKPCGCCWRVAMRA
jgi:hypothetical protein